jgi:NADPH:quinone reductase-like Zn-dependent oxidoreductase
VERPEPIQTEVLVRVTAAGINPVDTKIRRYGGNPKAVGEPPFILGWDVAGVVEETFDRVTRLAVDDRVFGMPWFPRIAGGYAEYVTSPTRWLAPAPDGLTDEQAAGLPLDGLTAWQSLVGVAGVGEGDRVLIHAAAGGVGHLAVQIAKARGAHVIGTARAAKHEFLREIGVDEPIDYTTTPWEDVLSDLDLVVDLIGTDDYGIRSLSTLREGGLLIVLPAGVPEAVAAAAQQQSKRTSGVQVEPDYCALESLAALADEGRLTVAIDETMPLAAAAEAHARLEEGHARGKIVLIP